MFYEDESIEYNYEFSNIDKLIENCKLIPVNLEDLVLNQLVYINFMPYSQKYIYNLFPKLGKLTKISNYDTINEFEILNYKKNIENLFHPSVSYYGDSLGYDYNIYLVE